MIVRNGITSFFRHKPIPEFSFAEFKQVVFASTMHLGFTITEMMERGVTPNFHIASLLGSNERLMILGHSTYPIIAFAEPFSPGSCELQFRDADVIAKRVFEFYEHITIASVEELTRRINDTDIEQLNDAEREQINYWKPRTIGELAFHWWD